MGWKSYFMIKRPMQINFWHLQRIRETFVDQDVWAAHGNIRRSSHAIRPVQNIFNEPARFYSICVMYTKHFLKAKIRIMFKLLVSKTRIHQVNDVYLSSVLFCTQIRNSFKIKQVEFKIFRAPRPLKKIFSRNGTIMNKPRPFYFSET